MLSLSGQELSGQEPIVGTDIAEPVEDRPDFNDMAHLSAPFVTGHPPATGQTKRAMP